MYVYSSVQSGLKPDIKLWLCVRLCCWVLTCMCTQVSSLGWSQPVGCECVSVYVAECPHVCVLRAPSQYPKRRLFVRSRKVSKPRDWYFKLSYRFEIWQAHRQHCCRSACQISERSDNSKYKSRSFETLRDLTERCLFGYWDGAQVSRLGWSQPLWDETATQS